MCSSNVASPPKIPPSSDVVLDHQRAAVLNVIEKALVIRSQVGADVPGSDAGDDGVEGREVGFHQIVGGQERDLSSHAADGVGNFVARS